MYGHLKLANCVFFVSAIMFAKFMNYRLLHVLEKELFGINFSLCLTFGIL